MLAVILYSIWFFSFTPGHDPVLHKIAIEYQKDAAKHGYTVDINDIRTMRFAQLEPYREYAIGFGLTPHVFIDAEYAATITDNELKQLVYHELTHSLFRCFGHSESTSSIMYYGGSYIKENQMEYAIWKLFNWDFQSMSCFNDLKRREM